MAGENPLGGKLISSWNSSFMTFYTQSRGVIRDGFDRRS
jgi:hypothetical protein